MIFVATGEYYVEGSDATATIDLVDGVSLFGGYDGSTTGTPDHRTLGSSIIDGQLNGSGGDDVYHVITANGVGSSYDDSARWRR